MKIAFLNLTLLYVEDDDIIRQNAVEYLSVYFKDVLEAENGQEGFDLLGHFHTIPSKNKANKCLK
ncbi:MAG: hypothetical protein Q9M39_06355 [Sulfurovum sp.]|nr:hypothetical protein [Sulfurovum sp.]